jgi:adenosylcobalamin-dependent ribonucleoside-triphosphate reductase
MSNKIFVRELDSGMGQAVAERTILRIKENGERESWGDVAKRVALGNSLLDPDENRGEQEGNILEQHIAKGTILLSGRHLQHGDINQPLRNGEVFTNCATAPTSFLLFYLLLNGSGVGRAYDDDVIVVNWDNAPTIRCVLDETHKDFDFSAHESARDAKHKYGNGKDILWFEVPDSREGWAKALEIWENSAFEKIHRDKMLILDFSKVRCRGSLIGGMQNRPASGPVPLMNAFQKAASLKGAGLSAWKQALFIDHYFAECVLVGGARRAARMSTKNWRDKTILDFIQIKRPIEFIGADLEKIINLRKQSSLFSFLWSSNNSVTVDKEYWDLLSLKKKDSKYKSELAIHARKVHELLTLCSYADGTGEPGIINQDKLAQNLSGWEDLNRGDYVGSKKYQLNDDTQILMSKLAKRAKKKKNVMITNPCGEVALNMLGAYCTIADVVPFHADTLDEAEDAFRATTRALIRTNLMDFLYKKEVDRTNRIGVGITGIHEFAWKFFGYGFRDLIDEKKSKDFWLTLNRFNHAVKDESEKYSKILGRNIPHTMTTIKPAGTTSKIFGLTEGWHLPAMSYYLRWVQFRSDDSLVETYKKSGYPTRELKTYQGTVIIGFPTCPTIASLGMEDRLVMAGDATPGEQYQWLVLGEKYWIDGIDENGVQQEQQYGNQISYTLKYRPELVSYAEFKRMLYLHQKKIKCCSVMPQADMTAYEYQPEEPITKAQYEEISRAIIREEKEDLDFSHVKCDGGACPVDFNKQPLN